MSRDNLKQAGKQTLQDPKMVSGELFTLTYGALVLDLIKDFESVEEVNRQLDKMGHNIGIRLADDFLSRNHRISKCSDMQQVAEIISKQALKTYLGVTAQTSILDQGTEFSIVLDTNPLVEFVEIPPEYKNLQYSQVICGVIRGALEAMRMEVQVDLVSDIPKPTEIHIKFLRQLHEMMPVEDED